MKKSIEIDIELSPPEIEISVAETDPLTKMRLVFICLQSLTQEDFSNYKNLSPNDKRVDLLEKWKEEILDTCTIPIK